MSLERRLGRLETHWLVPDPPDTDEEDWWSRASPADRDRVAAISAAAGTTPDGEVNLDAISDDDLDVICAIIEGAER